MSSGDTGDILGMANSSMPDLDLFTSGSTDDMSPGATAPPAPRPYGPREYIILFTTPEIVLLGSLFNCLSVAVLMRPRFRHMSTTVYLVALAVTDTIYLYSNSMTKNFIKVVWGFNYSTQFPMGCALYVYFLLASRCVGAWLVVSVTIERLVVICVPIKAKLIATRRRACIIVASLFTIIFSLYVYVLVVYEVSVDKKGKKGCDMKVYYVNLGVDFASKMIDMVIYSMIPTVVLFAGNAVIIYKVSKSSSFRQETAGGGSGAGGGGREEKQSLSSSRDDASRRLTIMLLSVSVAFLVFTLPLAAFLTHSTLWRVENFELYYRSFYSLQIINSAINFILYCASGPAFRKELLTMFGCHGDDKQWRGGGESGLRSEASQVTQSATMSEMDTNKA